jgi:hypothetical protein
LSVESHFVAGWINIATDKDDIFLCDLDSAIRRAGAH